MSMMMALMRVWLAVTLLAAGVAAAPQSAKDWKKAARTLGKNEKQFWASYSDRFREAVDTMWQPWRDARAKPKEKTNPIFDYSGFKNLYADYSLIQSELAKTDLKYAESGDPSAPAALLKKLLDVIKRSAKLDAEILKGKPLTDDIFDQEPSIRRHGLSIRHDGLVRALSQCADASGFLATTALDAAVKKDGKRSVARRVAILDALTQAGGTDAEAVLVEYLRHPEPACRIAALEGCLALGEAVREKTQMLLDDPSSIVRRALIQGVARLSKDPRWIPALVPMVARSHGNERRELLEALFVLTKQPFGDAPKLWEEWLDDYKNEIEGGNFDLEKTEIREAKPAPLRNTFSFCGIPTGSHGVVFVIDGSQRMHWPADWDVQKTQYKWRWDNTRGAWEKRHSSHQAELMREFGRMVKTWPAELRFGMISLQGAFKDKQVVGGKRLAKASSSRNALREIEKLQVDGWCAQYTGVLTAMRMAGVDPASDTGLPDQPAADTIFLFNGGDPAGGRYMTVDALVAAFRRTNRFRRVVVHTIRICSDGAAAEALMKGLAEASGGRYVWRRKPDSN